MSEQRCVLILSDRDYWSMDAGKGVLTLFNTLTSYAQRDWKVYFVTGNRPRKTHVDLHEQTWLS